MRAGALVVVLALAGCSGPGEGEGLRIAAPSRVTQAATSTDEDLCGKLAVDLTVRETSAAGAVIDREPLVPAATCEWELEDQGHLLARGTYSMLVRFVVAGSYPGRPECLSDGADPLWVGASYLEEVPFPFPPGFQGFTEDTFLSTPDDDAALFGIGERFGLAVSGFDVDGDGLDNLVEVAGASNPCRPNRPPQITLTVDDGPYVEGTPLSLTVVTEEPDGLQHDVEVTLRHGHGGAYAPEEAVVVLRPYAPDDISVDDAPSAQSWELGASVLDPRPESDAAGSWTLTLVPDEPFVGTLTVSAVARQKDGGPAFVEAPSPVTLDVEDLPDPLRLLVEDGEGDVVVAERLDFAEEGATGSPTTLRVRAESQDIEGGLASAIVLDDGPPGLTLGEDLSFTTLTWAPDNDVVQAAPPGGYSVTLRITAAGGGEVTQVVPLGITPTFNDAPLLADLATVNPNLSPEPFESKRLRFDVVDPDRVSGGVDREPTCAVSVWPEGESEGCTSACCTGAWASLTCAPDGELEGDTWHMVATLVPTADYFAVCGDRPSFVARLSATDKAPLDALPLEDKTVTTRASCSSAELAAGCRTHVTLLTSDITEAVTVAGWGGILQSDLNGTTGTLIDAVSGYAVVGVRLQRDGEPFPTSRVAVVRLTDPPEVMRIYEETELSDVEDTLNHLPAGVVDDVNHRAAVYARQDGTAVMALLETEPPFDVETWPIGTFCPGCTGFGCGSPPTWDGEGTIYVPCGRSGHGDVIRIAPDGTQTLADLDADIEGHSSLPGSTVILDETGAKWLLYPDLDGAALVELATFDDPAPHVERVDLGPEYVSSRLEGFATSADRRTAYLAFNQSTAGQAELHRIRVEGGSPVTDPPLVFGPPSDTTNGGLYHRILLRQPDPGALPGEPDLVLTGARSNLNYTRAMVDVDSWTLVPFPRPADAYNIVGLAELYETPDPRYYAALVRGSDVRGLYLFPWDPQQEPIVQNLGVPTGAGDIKQAWVTVSHELNAMTVNDNELHIIRFPQAP